MIRRSAGDDKNTGEGAGLFGGHGKAVQYDPPVRDTGRNCLADRFRLLHDLLEHEMRVAAFFRR